MIFFGVIDRVFWYLNYEIVFCNDGLARQARQGIESPCTIQQIFLIFIRFIQAVKAFTYDHVAGSAGT